MKVETPVLLVATNNAHKVREIGQILAPHWAAAELAGKPPLLLSGADFPHVPAPEETGETFEANALIKARAYAAATGLLTLADDSGLVVDALDGRPGVQSARYAETPAACIARVLSELAATPDAQRTARFRCVMALVDAQGRSLTRAGAVEGVITRAERGAGGFGYDPVFAVAEGPLAGQTLAELGDEVKNSLSHRARALAAFIPSLVASLLAGRVTER